MIAVGDEESFVVAAFCCYERGAKMSMSYVLDISGNDIDISIDRADINNEDRMKRLLGYYVEFLESKIPTDDGSNRKKLLLKIANSLSPEGIMDMMMKLKDAKGQEEVVKTINELLDAYEDENFDDYAEEEINGNRFTYLKTLDIGSIREKLFAVGNEVKGKKWRVELGEDGKVVLCE